MDKRTEVREILEGIGSGGISVDEGLRELDIVGVVIKVDRELPKCDVTTKKPCNKECHIQEQVNMLKAGYVAVEPLIDPHQGCALT